MGPVPSPSLCYVQGDPSTLLPAHSYAHLAETLQDGALRGVALLALT